MDASKKNMKKLMVMHWKEPFCSHIKAIVPAMMTVAVHAIHPPRKGIVSGLKVSSVLSGMGDVRKSGVSCMAQIIHCVSSNSGEASGIFPIYLAGEIVDRFILGNLG
jgi:hypothetical protein